MATGHLLFLFVSQFVLFVRTQIISTTTPVPPLQWINLSNILQGSAHPPPLRDAAIGYDETSRSLIIFGGLSQNGIAQSQTFLLDLQTLIWSNPSPPANLQRIPPSRSAALFGGDFAASNRHGFVVVGGKDANDNALSDAWEYDFNNQFWSQISLSSGGPSPRWGASGGIDIRVSPIQDPIVPGPNNTFYLAGGFNGNTASPLSDVWRLNISGTLSSNLPNSVAGSWEHLSISKLAASVEQAGTVVNKQIISTGGCNSTSTLTATNSTCAKQDSFIIDTQALSTISPGPCPAPRVSPVLVPNLNSFSSSFTSQTFMLLGTFNSSLWNDTNSLSRGEIAILDINTGSWTRILPSGDPDSSGTAHFPTPRQGASAFTFTEALVGDSRNTSSDTIIFGGQDANGTFLSDVWLLRAYTGVITPSTPTWTGFGNGNLQSGVNADGSGVRVQYLTQCASLVPTKTSTAGSSNNTSSSNPGNGNSGQPGPVTSPAQDTHIFDASFAHKLLAPLSIVVLLPVVLYFRWAQKGLEGPWPRGQRFIFVALAPIAGLIAYNLGIVGFILSFTTISSQSNSIRHLHLQTGHGIAGVVFFAGLYVCVPLIYIASAYSSKLRGIGDTQSQKSGSVLGNSIDIGEKTDAGPPPPRSDTPISLPNTSPPSSPRPRTLSWDASNVLRPTNDGGASPESSTPTPRGFEVVNRPNKLKTTQGSPQFTGFGGNPYTLPSTRSLGEIDWLLRRRSLNAVGELDYAITQAHNAQYALNRDKSSASPSLSGPTIIAPGTGAIFLHIVLQVSLVGLAAVSLAQLWARAPRYLFGILLVILAAFYAAMITLSWHHRPRSSLLTFLIWRLRGRPTSPTPSKNNTPDSVPAAAVQGPYTHHRAPFRLSSHPDELSYLHHASPSGVDTDDNDDDIDENTRQRAIEEEMDRREVSIVTVPRRKLAIANPS